LEILTLGGEYIVGLSLLDRGTCDKRHWFLISFNLCFSQCLFLVLLILNRILKFEINLAHTSLIAAFIVDQDISTCTFSAYITKNIFFTTHYVDVTKSLVKVVVVSAL